MKLSISGSIKSADRDFWIDRNISSYWELYSWSKILFKISGRSIQSSNVKRYLDSNIACTFSNSDKLIFSIAFSTASLTACLLTFDTMQNNVISIYHFVNIVRYYIKMKIKFSLFC